MSSSFVTGECKNSQISWYVNFCKLSNTFVNNVSVRIINFDQLYLHPAILTHCGIVMAYGIIDLGEYCLS